MTKTCDSCRSSNAAMYCKADMAYMCVECDVKVHGANKLASRHERVRICDVCEHAPAAVLCKADVAALCSACDNDIHSANLLAGRHERVPVTPFLECPSMIKVAHINASSGVNPGSGGDNWPPLFPPSPTSSGPPPVATVYDALLAAPTVAASFTTLDSFFSNPSLAGGGGGGGYESSYSLRHSRSSAVVPDSSSSMSDMSNTYSGVLDYLCLSPQAVAAMASNKDQPRVGREERVLRYREKKKNRKFEKTVRYASRKAYAEIRPRVKGRFVKRSSLASSSSDDAVEQYLLSSAIADGLVPSFC